MSGFKNLVDLSELYLSGEPVEFDTTRTLISDFNSKIVRLNIDFCIIKIEDGYIYIKELGTN